jgi:hypothetical protein
MYDESAPIRSPLNERWYISLFSVQSPYVIGLKLSLRIRLARQTRAQSVEKPIASLALWLY